MTLFNIALRNVKSNLKHYFLYFFSMIFSIVSIYTFQSIQYNSQMIEAAEESKRISIAFLSSSILLLVFVAVFIIYSNSFFIKKRKKEVGLYSLLGVPKKQIARMLFYENFALGMIALVIGIAIGAALSKIFISILLWLMNSDFTVTFEMPIKAVINTIVAFILVILYTSFQGYRLIYRFKLIELFYAEKQGEKAPKRRPILAIVGVILLATGYYFAYYFLDYIMKMQFLLPLLILGCTVTGTYLLFHFFIGYFLSYAKNQKSFFYKGMNMIGISQLLFRIKGNATSLATITTLCAVTICSTSISVATYINQNNLMKQAFPYSYVYAVKDNASEEKVNNLLAKYKKDHAVEHDAKVENIAIASEGYLPVSVMSYSEFKQFAKEFGYDSNVSIGSSEAIKLTSKMDNTFEKLMKTKMKNEDAKIPLGDRTITYKVKASKPYPVQNAYGVTYVIADKEYNAFKQQYPSTIVRLLDVKNAEKSKELTKALAKIVNVSDFYTPYTQNTESMGVTVFVGGLVGLVFLLATGSIIYFKQVAEANMDKSSYDMLRKIGVTKKEVEKSVFKQVGFVFLFPLLFAVLHSFFALKTAKILFVITDTSPFFWSAGIYILVYLGYYFFTSRSYVNIVNKK